VNSGGWVRSAAHGGKRDPHSENPNVEQVGKQDLESALKEATRHTAKGEYHKIHHGPKILSQLDVSRVRKAATHCNRLFMTLADRINRPYEPRQSR